MLLVLMQEADDWPQQAAARALQDALQGRGQWDVSPRSRASEWRSLAVLPVRLLAWLAQVRHQLFSAAGSA